MGQYLSWQATDLRFRPGLTHEQILAALEAVKAVAEKARHDGEAKIELVERGAGFVIAIGHLHGWNADLADALREQAHLFEDTGDRHGTCEDGDGHFFWRIKGGAYQDCGVLFEPDGHWAPAQPDDERQLLYLQGQGVRCPACDPTYMAKPSIAGCGRKEVLSWRRLPHTSWTNGSRLLSTTATARSA